jgi:hypothetical protein
MVYRQPKQQIPPLRCGMTNKKTETLYTNVNFALGKIEAKPEGLACPEASAMAI